MPALPVPEWIRHTVPKRGNRAEENEDASAASGDALRFALSDGATEGWESGPWAARLVAALVERPPEPGTFTDWLAAVRNWSPSSRSASAEAQPWYVMEKQQEGSFATLLGLELRRSKSTNGWTWRSVAVGDTCLFHVTAGKLALTFPIESAKTFGNRPALIASSTKGTAPDPEWCAGRAAPGDLLILATDAAAARLFDPVARSAALAAIGTALTKRDPAELTEWCKSVQEKTNDDVTVLAVRLPAG
jgi:hypothetical protein